MTEFGATGEPGYAVAGQEFAYGPCDNCGQEFGFNPSYVPSLRVGDRQLIFCRPCVERASASPERKALGLPPHVIHPYAYEPGPEGGFLP